MTNISPDFIHSIGSLYEGIYAQETQVLNEQSEYYDEEISSLVEDIITTISVSMVYEGYSAEGIISFLADSSEQNILEKYLTYDENLVAESTISEDYVQEQLEIVEYVISEGLGSVVKGALRLAGRIASKPARMSAAAKVMKSADPAQAIADIEKIAAGKVAKAGLDPVAVAQAPDLGTKVRMGVVAPVKGKIAQAVKTVKNLGAKAKAALPAVGKTLGTLGVGAVGGAIGAKMSGAGSQQPSSSAAQPPKPTTPSTPVTPSLPGKPKPSTPPTPPTGQIISAAGGKGGKVTAGTKYKATLGGQAGSVTYDTSGKRTFTPAKDTWSQANKNLATAAAEKQRIRGTSATDNPLMKDLKSALPAPSTPQSPEVSKLGKGYQSLTQNAPDQSKSSLDFSSMAKGAFKPSSDFSALGQKAFSPSFGSTQFKPTVGSEVDVTNKASQNTETGITPVKTPGSPDTSTEATAKKQKDTTTESYEPYDIILEYLIDGGHADTLDEANYIMLEMDTNAIARIMEEHENNMIAEEISDWVNSLVEEGYDLSDYSWDEIVEHYMTEAKYGTKKGRKKLAKKVRAGKDVGKKGAGFEKIVQKASPKYGKERATKIAAAAMWKNLGK